MMIPQTFSKSACVGLEPLSPAGQWWTPTWRWVGEGRGGGANGTALSSDFPECGRCSVSQAAERQPGWSCLAGGPALEAAPRASPSAGKVGPVSLGEWQQRLELHFKLHPSLSPQMVSARDGQRCAAGAPRVPPRAGQGAVPGERRALPAPRARSPARPLPAPPGLSQRLLLACGRALAAAAASRPGPPGGLEGHLPPALSGAT